MVEILPQFIESNEITMIDDSWFVTMAQRKRKLRTVVGNHSPFIAVFGSSMTEPHSRMWIKAKKVGEELANAGAITMNGGYGGIMEAVSAGASLKGGKVAGITCRDLPEKRANQFVTEEWIADRWDQRLLALVWLADGYIIFPGSSGTLVELSMVIETQLKGFLPFRPAVAIGNFWKPVARRIVDSEKIILFASTPSGAVRLALGKPENSIPK